MEKWKGVVEGIKLGGGVACLQIAHAGRKNFVVKGKEVGGK